MMQSRLTRQIRVNEQEISVIVSTTDNSGEYTIRIDDKDISTIRDNAIKSSELGIPPLTVIDTEGRDLTRVTDSVANFIADFLKGDFSYDGDISLLNITQPADEKARDATNIMAQGYFEKERVQNAAGQYGLEGLEGLIMTLKIEGRNILLEMHEPGNQDAMIISNSAIEQNEFYAQGHSFIVDLEAESADRYTMKTSTGFEIKGPEGYLTPDELSEDQIVALNEIIRVKKQEFAEAINTVEKDVLPPSIIATAVAKFAETITNPNLLNSAFEGISIKPVLDPNHNDNVDANDPLSPTIASNDGPQLEYSWYPPADSAPSEGVEQINDAKPIALPTLNN